MQRLETIYLTINHYNFRGLNTNILAQQPLLYDVAFEQRPFRQSPSREGRCLRFIIIDNRQLHDWTTPDELTYDWCNFQIHPLKIIAEITTRCMITNCFSSLSALRFGI